MKIPKEIKDNGNLRHSQRECSIRGCSLNAERSLPEVRWKSPVKMAKLTYEKNKRKKIYLCHQHYKESNKQRKRTEKDFQKKGFLENSIKYTKPKF